MSRGFRVIETPLRSLGQKVFDISSNGGMTMITIFDDEELANRICELMNDDGTSFEQAEGKRYRTETVTIKTKWNDVGQVEQLVNSPSGVMQRRVLNTLEQQTREALTALGWTPPPAK